MKIKDRIIAALSSAPTRSMKHYPLMSLVFPPSEYPNAWGYASGGGPPGCAMAFGSAIRKLRESKMLYDTYEGRGYTSERTYHLLPAPQERRAK